MPKVKTTISSISDEEFDELRNEKVDLKFIWKKAQEHFTYMIQLNEKFVIVSIDMQPSFLKNIANKFRKKINILIEYHRELKRLCKLNNIPFIEVEYGQEENVLRSTELYFKKTTPAINDRGFFFFLKDYEIKNIFMIGIYRNACVLDSMNVCYQEKNEKGERLYNLFTSLIGLGTRDSHLWHTKNFQSSRFTLKEFFTQAKILKVQVLDYDESRLGWRL